MLLLFGLDSISSSKDKAVSWLLLFVLMRIPKPINFVLVNRTGESEVSILSL